MITLHVRPPLALTAPLTHLFVQHGVQQWYRVDLVIALHICIHLLLLLVIVRAATASRLALLVDRLERLVIC